DVPGGTGQRHRHVRFDIQARAAGHFGNPAVAHVFAIGVNVFAVHVVVGEAHRFGIDARLEPAPEAFLPGAEQPRLAAVGQGAFGQRVVGQLPVVGHEAGGPAATGAVDAGGALQIGGGHTQQAVGEILQVALVA